MMVGSPGLSIDTRSTRLSPLLAPTQLSYHNSRERILSVSSSTSSLSSEHTYPSFQRGSIDLRTKLANNSPPQQPRSPNSPHFPKERIDDPSGRYVISPRLAPSLLPKSPSQTHQPSPSSPTGSLPGFPTGYQPGHVRRRDGSASSLIIPFDPYRSRQPQSPPGKRTNKNDQPGQYKHQHQQQRQGQGYGSDDGYEKHPHMVEGGFLSDDQAFAMLHHQGSVPSSPTSASLLYHSSPMMPNQYQAPLDGYHGHTSRAMSPSPHMAPVDPYRSAYSQQQLYQYQQQHPHQQQSYSPYQTHLASQGSSPMVPYDDLSSSYDSRYSGSTQPNQFPMYPLSPQNSNQALTAAYQHHQQQLLHAQQLARRDSSIDLAGVARPHSQQSMTLLSPQPTRAGSKTASTSTGSRRLQSEAEEEEENAEILQKVSQSGTRSGMTLASSQSTGKNNKRFGRGGKEHKSSDIDDDDDEEEGQEKGASRQRDGKRCWCCSRRMCVYMSFVFLLCLAVALYFVLPRSPAISFVNAQGPAPVFSRGRIQESFTLQMRVDSSDNYLPIKLSSVDMTVWWKLDGTKIGTNDGLSSSVTIRPKMVQTISLPMAFDYQSLRIDPNTDGVLDALTKACTPLPPGSTNLPNQLNLTFGGKMKVWGLSWVWKPEFSFNVGMACPSNSKDQNTPQDPAPPATPSPATAATPSASGSASATSGGAQATTSSGGNSATANATPTSSPRP